MNYNILIAGFGGQGILFAGKILAYSGLMDGREVSWLPSYGPEMRGGTCNCSVCISDDPIGSPLVVNPDILIVMNTPSLEKFSEKTVSGGLIISDSSMVDAEVEKRVESERTDIKFCSVPATELTGNDPELRGGANIILLGKLMAETGIISMDTFEKALEKVVPPNKKQLIEHNIKAIKIGMAQ